MLNVEEPQAGTRSVSLTVQRTGGQTGVITLKYEVTLNGNPHHNVMSECACIYHVLS